MNELVKLCAPSHIQYELKHRANGNFASYLMCVCRSLDISRTHSIDRTLRSGFALTPTTHLEIRTCVCVRHWRDEFNVAIINSAQSIQLHKLLGSCNMRTFFLRSIIVSRRYAVANCRITESISASCPPPPPLSRCHDRVKSNRFYRAKYGRVSGMARSTSTGEQKGKTCKFSHRSLDVPLNGNTWRQAYCIMASFSNRWHSIVWLRVCVHGTI